MGKDGSCSFVALLLSAILPCSSRDFKQGMMLMANPSIKSSPVYAFIDGQNLYKSVEEQKWKLNYQKFRIYLKDKFNVQKAFYFIGYMKEMKWLYELLKKTGYIPIYKKILYYDPNDLEKTKGNIDAELVLHTMIHYHEFSQAVVVAGDGDYYCLVEYLNKTNKLRSIIIPNKKKYSALLRDFGNKRFFLSDERKKLEFKSSEIK